MIRKTRRRDPQRATLRMHSFSKSEFNGSRLVANLDRGHADIGIVPPVDSGPSFAPAGAVSFGGPSDQDSRRKSY